jgi:hypothetical protein
MRDTVESRMMEMLKQKYGDRDESDDEGDNDDSTYIPDAAEAAKANNTLVGSVNSDKATVLAAEFDLLFGYEHQEEEQHEIVPDATGSLAHGALNGAAEESEVFFDAQEDCVPDMPISFPASRRGPGWTGADSGRL